MSRIDRYIFLQMLGLFGFFALMLVAIYWVNRAIGLLDALLSDGQSVGVFLQMSLLTVPGVIELTAPTAAFGAAVFTANKLMTDSELVVLQATGFSSFRLARAAVMFGVAVAIMTAIVTNYLIPAAATQLRELNTQISQNNTAKYLKEGQFLSPSAGIVLFIREVSTKGQLLDIFISDTRNAKTQQIYTAQSAYLVNDSGIPKLLMIDGLLQSKDVKNNIVSVSRFSDLTYSLEALLQTSGSGVRGINELSTLESIIASDTSVAETGYLKTQLQYSGHVRMTWPLSTAATAIVGFSTLLLGAHSRFGLWRQILAAIAFLILLYTIHIVTLGSGPYFKGGWILAYLTPLVGAIMAICILWLSQRPKRFKLMEKV